MVAAGVAVDVITTERPCKSDDRRLIPSSPDVAAGRINVAAVVEMSDTTVPNSGETAEVTPDGAVVSCGTATTEFASKK